MTINFDNQSVDIPCPNCGQKITETLGRLKQNPALTCPGCNASITIDADEFRRVEQSVKDQLDALMKSFGKLR